MQLLPNQSPEYDRPCLLLALAESLTQMHADGEPHGAIALERAPQWMNGADFDYNLFLNTRRPILSPENKPDAIRDDVESFLRFSRDLITGSVATSGIEFKAALYRGNDWSEDLLNTLERFSQTKSLEPHSMQSVLKLFKTPVKRQKQTEAAIKQSVPSPTGVQGPTPPPPLTTAGARANISFQLRNGTVGRPYEVEAGAIAKAIAKQWGDNLNSARVDRLQFPENSGLHFNSLDGSITGVPTRAFEEALSIEYESHLGAQAIPLSIKLLINPDPSSLWKDLPFPIDAPYQKDSTIHSEYEFGPFRIVAASRRGRSHANKGDFRDDDYDIGFAPDTGWLVVAVADGAGSAKYSRRGSQIACAVAKRQLVAALNCVELDNVEELQARHQNWQHPAVKLSLRKALYEAALLAHHELVKEVSLPQAQLSHAPTLRNFDTTLILLTMKKTADGYIAASFSIGDGGAGILSDSNNGQPLTQADSGEHAGQTTFLTFPATLSPDEENLGKRFNMTLLPQLAGALAMTDGITDPKFPSDAAFADPEQWVALWSELQPVLSSSAALLDWMNFFSPGNHDDRTLVAVLPASLNTPPLS